MSKQPELPGMAERIRIPTAGEILREARERQRQERDESPAGVMADDIRRRRAMIYRPPRRRRGR